MLKKIIRFEATIKQDSSLLVSGSETSYKYIDSFFARDGLNRLTIPGSSIAGSIVSFARKMGIDFEDLEEFTSKYRQKKGRKQFISRMKVFNAHPIDKNQRTEVRQMNGLLQKTRATAEEKKALFNVESTPKDTKWNFKIEVEIYDDDSGEKTAEVVAKVLTFWKKRFGLLGGLTNRGMGWITLSDLQVSQAEQARWDSFTPIEITSLISEQVTTTNALKIKEYTGTIKVGQKDDGYGIDSLFVGGSELEPFDFEENREYIFLKPEGQTFPQFLEGDGEHGLKGADTFFITSHYNGGSHPFIPGSSLRGAIRHSLSRLERIAGVENIEDPNLKNPDFSKDESVLSQMFGFVGKNGDKDKDALDSTILISDCHLKDTTNYKLAMLEHHTEDEFTQGAYGSAKFNEVALFEGKFEFKIVIMEDEKTSFNEKITLFEKIKTEMEKSQMALGGKVFRGHGWPQFIFDVPKEYQFGEVE